MNVMWYKNYEGIIHHFDYVHLDKHPNIDIIKPTAAYIAEKVMTIYFKL